MAEQITTWRCETCGYNSNDKQKVLDHEKDKCKNVKSCYTCISAKKISNVDIQCFQTKGIYRFGVDNCSMHETRDGIDTEWSLSKRGN